MMEILVENKKMRRSSGAEVVIDIVDTGVREVSILRGCVEVVPYRGKAASGSSSGTLSGEMTVDYQDYSGHGTMVAYLAKQMYSPAVIHSYCAIPADPRTGQRTMGEYVNAALADIIKRVKADTRRHVVNMSLGGEGSISVGNAAAMHDLIRQLVALDVPVVCSAGNDGREAQLDRYPSCFQEPICISAVDSVGSPAPFSTWHGEVDFAELGVGVPVIDLYGAPMVERGTSLAAPIVAGKIAAMLGQHPTMTEPEVYAALKANAVDLGAAGYDPHCGWGWIASLNVAAAEPPKPEDEEEEKPVANEYPILKLIPKPRMSGDAVRKLQTLLTANKIAIDIDGIFGPATDTAVRQYQAVSGLTVDGIVGAKTWAALEGGADSPPALDPVPGKDTVSLMESFRAHLYPTIGDTYALGGNGERVVSLTSAGAWIRRMDTSGDPERSIRYLRAQLAAGVTDIRLWDCSGLISRWLQDHGFATSKRNCDHLAAMCRKITRAELQPLDLVFRAKRLSSGALDYYHVGVYIGSGRVIEAKGRDDGVVLRGIDASGSGYWTDFGRLTCLYK